MNIISALLKDGYKVGHKFQYPDNTTLVYSNLTARSSRVEGVDAIVAFGFQYFVKRWLIEEWNQNFFSLPKDEVIRRYKRRIDNYLGPGVGTDHIAALHDLKYLPLLIKAVPEGTIVPLRIPCLTIRNTHPDFGWLTNMVETLLSAVLWGPITSATTALRYRRTFEKYADLTGADKAFVKWQGHDFSMRGMEGVEAAAISGAAHLLCFTGTDTIPAIDLLEQYYFADCEKELIGGSVPATEHSVISMSGSDDEKATLERLLTKVYPSGVFSNVSDTWDFWNMITTILPKLKDKIMERDGKLVIRPDSGDPVDIICGSYRRDFASQAEQDGAIESLWKIFGGSVNEAGFKVLDPHIGLIYGDSITPERQLEILERLRVKGFASSNVVLGIGSFTYQHVTRDTYGLAVKATYGEIGGVGRAIFKAPKTDDGTKNSATGLLRVDSIDGKLVLKENCSWEDENGGLLIPIFEDGQVGHVHSLAGIRKRLEAQI